MPLMHAEDMTLLDLGVKMYAELEANALKEESEWKNDKFNYSQFMIAHRDVVVKFGRYPMRNKALGRESTKEEIEYMESRKGNMF